MTTSKSHVLRICQANGADLEKEKTNLNTISDFNINVKMKY